MYLHISFYQTETENNKHYENESENNKHYQLRISPAFNLY